MFLFPVTATASYLTSTTCFPYRLIFNVSCNSDREQFYSTFCNTVIYKEYAQSTSIGNVFLVDFYSDGNRLSKSETQGVTFIRDRFGNIRPHSETWFTVEIATTDTFIPSTLLNKKWRNLKLRFLHGFIVDKFRSLIRAAYNGFIENCSTFIPRITMIVVDLRDDRSLMWFKRRDTDIYCSYFSLSSRIRELETAARSPSYSTSSSDADRPISNDVLTYEK